MYRAGPVEVISPVVQQDNTSLWRAKGFLLVYPGKRLFWVSQLNALTLANQIEQILAQLTEEESASDER